MMPIRANLVLAAQSSGKVAGSGSSVLSGNVLQFNQTAASSIGASAAHMSKPSRLHTSQGNRMRPNQRKADESVDDLNLGRL